MFDPKFIIRTVAEYFFRDDQSKKEASVKFVTAAVTILTAAAGALQLYLDAVK